MFEVLVAVIRFSISRFCINNPCKSGRTEFPRDGDQYDFRNILTFLVETDTFAADVMAEMIVS